MWILKANCQQEFLLYQNLQQKAFGPERWIHFDQKCFEWNGLLNNKVFLRLIQIFFQVSYEVDWKTFNTMSRILSFPKIQYCDIIGGMSTIPLIAGLLNFTKSLERNIWNFCSGPGEFSVSNITLANSILIEVFPSGDYKTYFVVYDDKDRNIFNITFEINVRK